MLFLFGNAAADFPLGGGHDGIDRTRRIDPSSFEQPNELSDEFRICRIDEQCLLGLHVSNPAFLREAPFNYSDVREYVGTE